MGCGGAAGGKPFKTVSVAGAGWWHLVENEVLMRWGRLSGGWRGKGCLGGSCRPGLIVDKLAVLCGSVCEYWICQEMKLFGSTNHAQRTGSLNSGSARGPSSAHTVGNPVVKTVTTNQSSHIEWRLSLRAGMVTVFLLGVNAYAAADRIGPFAGNVSEN